MPSSRVVIVGAGPAGLMAAETLARGGAQVVVHERMPSPARRLLMAGRGGLNLTHSEGLTEMIARYGDRSGTLAPLLEAFPPQALRDWAEGLGQDTFVGSSGRVFPRRLKASPLVRAWLARLDGLGVELRLRSTWTGWDGEGRPTFRQAGAEAAPEAADALLLSMGGASWPRLGADGTWVATLAAAGVASVSLRPANCGFVADFSPVFPGDHAGRPLKGVEVRFAGRAVRGEVMLTRQGIEGGRRGRTGAPSRDRSQARPQSRRSCRQAGAHRPEGQPLQPSPQGPGPVAAGDRAPPRSGAANVGPGGPGGAHPLGSPAPDRDHGAGPRHLHRRWYPLRGPRPGPSAPGPAGGLDRRGDARLGGAHGGLSPPGRLRHRRPRRPGHPFPAGMTHLPDAGPRLRRQVHAVPRLHTEGLVEGVDIAHRDVDARSGW